MRSIALAVMLVTLTVTGARGEFRLISDLVSAGAADGQGGAFRLQGSVGESPSDRITGPPWVLQQGFWFLWRKVVGIPETPETLPQRIFDFQLDQNAPNPFNPVTRIAFVVPGETGEVALTRLDIVDVQGRLVRTLVNAPLTVGTHRITWAGDDNGGRPVGSGVYFYRLLADGHSSIRRLVLLK